MKVKKGVGISAIKGKLGGFIIQDPTVGTTLRVKSIATFPRSLAQFRTKARFVAVNASWRNLTPVQQAAWVTAAPNFPRVDQFGVIYFLTGFELFSYINNDLLQYGFAPFLVPPVAGVVPDYTALSWTTDPGVNMYISPTPGIVPADNICEVWATPQLSRGRSYYDAKFRLIGHVPAGTTAPFDITLMYEDVFGKISNTRSVILCRIRNLMITTGQVNSAFFQTNIYLPAMCPDQNIFVPNPEWPVLTSPAENRIKLLMSDEQDRRIVFSATISGAGSYTVDVYGAAGVLINSQVKANNATYDYTVPNGAGYPATGYTTYIIEIYPTVGANQLRGFRVLTVAAYAVTNWQILYARFHTSFITDLASAFSGIDALNSVAFDSAMDSLTTLASFNLNGLMMKSITFPSMAGLTTLSQAFSGCVNLKICNFPKDLPSLQDLGFCFSGCVGLLAITYPATLNALTSMSNTHLNNSALLSCTMPTSTHLLATMIQAFQGCKVLQSIILPNDMHHLTSLNLTFRDCFLLESIGMPTVLTALQNLSQTFMNCHKLTDIIFPAILNTVTTCASMCQGCWSLASNISITLQGNTTFNNAFSFCQNLASFVLNGTAGSVTDMQSMFDGCLKLVTAVFPASMNAVTNASSWFSNTWLMTTCTLPTSMDHVTTFGSAFNNTRSMVTITLPATLTALQNMTSLFYNCLALTTVNFPASLPAINNLGTMASVSNPLLTTLSTPAFGAVQADAIAIIKGDSEAVFNWPTLRVTRISIVALAPAAGNALTSIEINWAASLYAGASPQILFTYQNISAVEIDRIFTALPVVVGKRIDVRNCTGALACHPAIATAKGWTVVNV